MEMFLKLLRTILLFSTFTSSLFASKFYIGIDSGTGASSGKKIKMTYKDSNGKQKTKNGNFKNNCNFGIFTGYRHDLTKKIGIGCEIGVHYDTSKTLTRTGSNKTVLINDYDEEGNQLTKKYNITNESELSHRWNTSLSALLYYKPFEYWSFYGKLGWYRLKTKASVSAIYSEEGRETPIESMKTKWINKPIFGIGVNFYPLKQEDVFLRAEVTHVPKYKVSIFNKQQQISFSAKRSVTFFKLGFGIDF